MNCTDVFADIGNVNLFNGEELLHADRLEPQPTELTYKDNYGTARRHHLDTCMKATGQEEEADIAIFCIENQSEVSNIMPVRDMGYLYSAYNEQIRQIRQENERNGRYYSTAGIDKEQKLTPVISIILYYGSEKWDGPEKLSDMLSIPEKWKEKLSPWIAEHPIHVINLTEQDESVRAKYKSDFRHVADYFACLGDADKIRKFAHEKNRVVRHPEEYLDMLAAFSGKKQFGDIKRNVLYNIENWEEGVKMDDFFDILENMAREEGKQEIIRKMLGKGKTPEQINELIEEPLEYIYQVREQMPQSAGQDIAYGTDGD